MRSLTTLALLSVLALLLVACQPKEGPVERAGRQVDQGIQSAADTVEDAADDLEDATKGR